MGPRKIPHRKRHFRGVHVPFMVKYRYYAVWMSYAKMATVEGCRSPMGMGTFEGTCALSL